MFVEAMAARFPQRNYLGVEIREELVTDALARLQQLREPSTTAHAQRNLHHVAGNVLDPGWALALLASLAEAGYR
jgi:tRNA G46 methylase TrmB